MFSQAFVCPGGRTWQKWGVCVGKGSVRGEGVCVAKGGGMCDERGVCVAEGVHGRRWILCTCFRVRVQKLFLSSRPLPVRRSAVAF